MDLHYRKALEDHRQDPLMDLHCRNEDHRQDPLMDLHCRNAITDHQQDLLMALHCRNILKTHVALSLVTLVGDIGDPLRLCGCKIRGHERSHRWKEHGKFEPEQIDRHPITELETPGPELQLHANHKSHMALNQAIPHTPLRT